MFHSVTLILSIKYLLACNHFFVHSSNFHCLVVKTVDPSHPDEKEHQGDNANNDIIKETPHPNHVPSEPSMNSDRQPTYTWAKSGYTDCSTTCGTGEERHSTQKKW